MTLINGKVSMDRNRRFFIKSLVSLGVIVSFELTRNSFASSKNVSTLENNTKFRELGSDMIEVNGWILHKTDIL